MAKLSNKQLEGLKERLNKRYSLWLTCEKERERVNKAYYEGVCEAICLLGCGWVREVGKHRVFNQERRKMQITSANDMSQFVGMNFREWCAIDEDDERKIYYETSFGNFTNEDWISNTKMEKVRKAIIQKIDLINNEWHVTLK